MPDASDAQRRYFNWAAAHGKGGITHSMANEFNQASKGMSLPEHAVRSGFDRLSKKKKKKAK